MKAFVPGIGCLLQHCGVAVSDRQGGAITCAKSRNFTNKDKIDVRHWASDFQLQHQQTDFMSGRSE